MANRNDDEFLRWLQDNKNQDDLNDINKENFENRQDDIEQTSDFEHQTFFNKDQKADDDNMKFEDKDFVEDSKEDYFSESSSERPNEDYINRIYVDKDYVDEQIAKSKSKFSTLKILSLILVGAILGSFLGPIVQSKFIEPNSSNISSQETININSSDEANVENAVAKKAIPSVVGIHTSYIQSNPFMFGMEKKAEGIGSGVIVSEDGYILTNAHVVGKNPEKISVLFSDNTSAEAEIVYKNTNLDLAVIKVNKTGLPAIEFADSSKVQIGDKAIAIGNPLGFNLQSTLTSGYISGLDRSITMQDGTTMTSLMQTDASINSGNSGGALLNSKGQLIGINTAKAGSTDGIGFAIPSNTSKNIVDQIIEKGSFSQVVLGINGIDLDIYKQYTNNRSIEASKGVYVAEALKNSSADKAGLKSGDVITQIDDVEIDSMNKLQQTLITKRVGEKGKIKIIRNNKELDLDITYEGQQANI